MRRRRVEAFGLKKAAILALFVVPMTVSCRQGSFLPAEDSNPSHVESSYHDSSESSETSATSTEGRYSSHLADDGYVFDGLSALFPGCEPSLPATSVQTARAKRRQAITSTFDVFPVCLLWDGDVEFEDWWYGEPSGLSEYRDVVSGDGFMATGEIPSPRMDGGFAWTVVLSIHERTQGGDIGDTLDKRHLVLDDFPNAGKWSKKDVTDVYDNRLIDHDHGSVRFTYDFSGLISSGIAEGLISFRLAYVDFSTYEDTWITETTNFWNYDASVFAFEIDEAGVGFLERWR